MDTLTNNIDLKQKEILDSLSPQERELALSILAEMSKDGHSQKLNDLLYEDYNEIPVDIETFINDDNYLGKAWKDIEGNSKLYPFWLEQLQELFPDNLTTDVNNFIESGARGLGKSEIACLIAAYLMYRVLCLKDPLEHFHMKATEKICFAFMNITKILAEDIGISKFQNTIQMSPWFMSRGTLTQRNNMPYWTPPEPVKIIIGSQSSHVIGQPIYFAFFDEISFIRNQDIDKQKRIAMDMIDTAIGGMKTRFIHKGKNPTLLVLASSKRSEKSFLEEHMKKKLKTEGENVKIVDEPVWRVKPKGTYSEKTFRVAIGNKFLQSTIIPEEDTNSVWLDKGYTILPVPIDFMADFLDDIDRALCDFAGISSSDLSKYISGTRWAEIKNKDRQNLFTKEIIEVGNAPDDKQQYYDYIDINRVDEKLKYKPLFIHLDMSLSGDKTGIAGVWIIGKKPHQDGVPDSKELMFKLAFNVSIKAPKGYQISFEKNRNFVRWLKEQGFAVKCVSSDSYQSADLQQQLKAEGFKCEIISVDKVDTESKVCLPYQFFKSVIYEKRIDVYNECDLLTTEVLGLERNASTGKIDHPDGGRSGSKDSSDAVCGGLWSASKYAEQFAYDFGESLETITTTNLTEIEIQKQQLVVDFEEELKKVFDPLGVNSKPQEQPPTNNSNSTHTSTIPKPQTVTQPYLHNGIIVW